MNDDLISRQAVIDIIHRFFTEEVDKIPTKKTEDGEVLVIHKCQPLFAMNKAICKRIKALPSDSLTQNCVGSALDMRCDDAISRQAVLDEINSIGVKGFETYNDYSQLFDFVDTLPSVNPQEPKTGHWIMTSDYLTTAYGSMDYVKCSCCGEDSLEEGDFCPNCGARMESEE